MYIEYWCTSEFYRNSNPKLNLFYTRFLLDILAFLKTLEFFKYDLHL